MTGAKLLLIIMSLLCHLHGGYYDSHHASGTMTVPKEPNKEERWKMEVPGQEGDELG